MIVDQLELKKIVQGKTKSVEIENLIRKWWKEDRFVGMVETSDIPNKEKYQKIPWVKVDCMHTKLIGRTADEVGFGLDLFAPKTDEKSVMHLHPYGDRIAMVMEGEGTFFALKDGELIQKQLKVGDMVLFPRNVPHAFWGSETESLLLHVVLNPFVEFEHPEHTLKSPEGEQALRIHGLL